MGLTYEEAKRCGLAHLYPTGGKSSIPAIVPPSVSAAPKDGMNKLERAFWGRLKEAKDARLFREVWEHPFKLRVISGKYYIPDFAGQPMHFDKLTIYETKGWMREDAELKLLAAAERYQCFNWVLVQKDRGRWRCIDVTAVGFSKIDYTPDWLR